MFFLRWETPQANPTKPTFLPEFNRVGQDVWKQWDVFLDKANGVIVHALSYLFT
jgi:hypothetical protein